MTEFLSLRVNPELKGDFYNFCRRKGLTAGKAVNLLARQFARDGELPFPIDADRKYPDENLTPISLRMDGETRQLFAEACERFGLPMSTVVRGFMDFCTTTDRLPCKISNKVEKKE